MPPRPIALTRLREAAPATGAYAGPPLRPVTQEETTGCGIASVATLARVSYAEARGVAQRLGISAQDPSLWSETHHVRTLLRRFGLVPSPDETPFRSWDTLPPLALLATKWHLERGRPFWHWAVFCRTPDGPVVLDSRKDLKAHLRRDLGRIRPRWYIECIRATDADASAHSGKFGTQFRRPRI